MLCELLAAVVLCCIPCAAYRQPDPEDLVANAFFQVAIQPRGFRFWSSTFLQYGAV